LTKANFFTARYKKHQYQPLAINSRMPSNQKHLKLSKTRDSDSNKNIDKVASEEQFAASSQIDPESTTPCVYITHVDPHTTTEGLGSHVRGTIYPLLHLAHYLSIVPVWNVATSAGFWQSKRSANTEDYSLLDLAELFGISETTASWDDKDRLLDVHTWVDPIIGNAYGKVESLSELLESYLHSIALHQKPRWIRVHGAFSYQNPTPMVYRHLQQAKSSWKDKRTNNDTNDSFKTDSSMSDPLRIGVHVRVPEDWCGNQWKEDNYVSHVIETLQSLQRSLPTGAWECVALNVVSEIALETSGQAAVLRQAFPQATFSLGNPIVNEIKHLALSDIFLPAASHLSALVGYFVSPQNSLILLPVRRNRCPYLEPHIALGAPVIVADGDNQSFVAALQILWRRKRNTPSRSRSHGTIGDCEEGEKTTSQ
jgi:hypothetical protein